MLELDRLTRRFGALLALDRLSFTVGEGEVFGFVGPNGAGKTTAMRIVLGVLSADAGEVRFGGRPVDDATRRRFGYMPEERGLEGRWSSPVESLSLGNQQRVQLAVALVHRPGLLVLDEPFSGLDPIGVDVLSGVLRRHASGGSPVIFSSHQLDLVERLCDAVAIIDRGRLVASGPVAELVSGAGARRYRIGLEGAADPSSLTSLPGVELVASGDGQVEVLLANGVDDQAVLDATRRAGRVVEFVRVRPRLTDIFRGVIEQ